MCIFRQKVITQHTDYSVGSAEWASQVALVVKNPPASAAVVRDAGLIPGLGRSPGGGHGNLVQCSCLQNLMDRGAWWVTVHRVTESRILLRRLRCTHAEYSVKMHVTFIFTGKPKSSCDSLYCDICWITTGPEVNLQYLHHMPVLLCTLFFQVSVYLGD